MSKYGKIWDGNFCKDIIKNYKISFCTTCMGRLHNLRETLPKNIEDNKEYKNLEFVILDYNSQDGLEKWIRENMMRYIELGRVSYYRTNEPRYFSMAHSRNMAFKVATGDIINNLDADNYTKDCVKNKGVDECFAFYLNRVANECGEKVIFAKGKRGMHGRIGFYKNEFMNILGGYDENLLGYGCDDHDLVRRAWSFGFIMYWWGGKYYSRMKTSTKEKNMNMERSWKITENENKVKSENNIKDGKFKANEGKCWGKGILIKNFKEEVVL